MDDNLARLNAFIRETIGSSTFDDILAAACGAAREIADADRVAIYLQPFDTDDVELRLIYGINLLPAFVATFAVWPRKESCYLDGSAIIAYANTIDLDDAQRAMSAAGEYVTSVEIPLKLDHFMHGMLLISHTTERVFSGSEIQTLEILAFQVALAAKNAALSRRLEIAASQARVARPFAEEPDALMRRLQRLVFIDDIATQLSGALNIDDLINKVLEATINVTDADMVALALLNEGGEFQIYGRETVDGQWQSARMARSRYLGVMGEVAATGRSRIIDDNSVVAEYVTTSGNGKYSSSLAVPLKQDGRVIGVLDVESCQSAYFTQDHLEFVQSLVGHATVSIQNARLLRERQEQYNKILESNNRISIILDSSSDGIILLDQTGLLVQFNRSAEDMLGINLDDYIHENLATMLLDRVKTHEDSPETRDGLQKMARILRLEPERITRHEYELKRRGQSIFIEEVGSPVLDAQHKVVGRLLVLRDMTEHKLLSDYRDEITNMAVHDLRGPLGSIISSLTLAQEIIYDPMDMPLDLTLVPSLQVSVDSANHLLGLVDSLLDIAKMETRQLPIKRTPWDIKELIDSGLSALSRLYQEAGLLVDKRVSDDLPLVSVDEDKIRRVIINLLDNALRYSPENGVVRVGAALVDNGKRVQVRVADSGKGIPPEERDRIFEKFRQIKENAPERGRKGSGLGLTFCKLAIEAHGCQIWVEENGPLSGASFVFTLPVSFENRNNT